MCVILRAARGAPPRALRPALAAPRGRGGVRLPLNEKNDDKIKIKIANDSKNAIKHVKIFTKRKIKRLNREWSWLRNQYHRKELVSQSISSTLTLKVASYINIKRPLLRDHY